MLAKAAISPVRPQRTAHRGVCELAAPQIAGDQRRLVLVAETARYALSPAASGEFLRVVPDVNKRPRRFC